MKQTCSGCKCYKPEEGRDAHGICRSLPPTVHIDYDGEANTIWPTVHENEWCMCWVQRSEKELSEIRRKALEGIRSKGEDDIDLSADSLGYSAPIGADEECE